MKNDEERDAAIADLFDETKSLSEVGKKFGLTEERVRQIVMRVRRERRANLAGDQ
jgi:DNA-directed RNA polymerase sigma subunit (sigma70/sigma32)